MREGRSARCSFDETPRSDRDFWTVWACQDVLCRDWRRRDHMAEPRVEISVRTESSQRCDAHPCAVQLTESAQQGMAASDEDSAMSQHPDSATATPHTRTASEGDQGVIRACREWLDDSSAKEALRSPETCGKRQRPAMECIQVCPTADCVSHAREAPSWRWSTG